MSEKRGALPLVGKFVKQRLREFGQQMRREWREGYDEFKGEVASELADTPKKAAEDTPDQTLLTGVSTSTKK
jgi:hypothetical protein